MLLSTRGNLLNGHLTGDLQGCSCDRLRAQTPSQGLSTEGLDGASDSLCLPRNIDLDWEERYPSVFVGNAYSFSQRKSTKKMLIIQVCPGRGFQFLPS